MSIILKNLYFNLDTKQYLVRNGYLRQNKILKNKLTDIKYDK